MTQRYDLIVKQVRDPQIRIDAREHRLVYLQGERFVRAIAERVGDDAVLQHLLREPPQSTWEIKDPSRYLQRTGAADLARR